MTTSIPVLSSLYSTLPNMPPLAVVPLTAAQTMNELPQIWKNAAQSELTHLRSSVNNLDFLNQCIYALTLGERLIFSASFVINFILFTAITIPNDRNIILALYL